LTPTNDGTLQGGEDARGLTPGYSRRPEVRYGVARPATACQQRPVSSQQVSASVAAPSVTGAPATAQSGTPAGPRWPSRPVGR